ncbi:MAG: serine protease Do [Granulosicoccus sp.]|jgi:serine protease Do
MTPNSGLDQVPEQYRKFFEQQQTEGPTTPRQGMGLGSGFLISDDGYIITNAHVLDNATAITVSLQDLRELEATAIGSDVHTDIALIKVDADTLALANGESIENSVLGLTLGKPTSEQLAERAWNMASWYAMSHKQVQLPKQTCKSMMSFCH